MSFHPENFAMLESSFTLPGAESAGSPSHGKPAVESTPSVHTGNTDDTAQRNRADSSESSVEEGLQPGKEVTQPHDVVPPVSGISTL